MDISKTKKIKTSHQPEKILANIDGMGHCTQVYTHIYTYIFSHLAFIGENFVKNSSLSERQNL